METSWVQTLSTIVIVMLVNIVMWLFFIYKITNNRIDRVEDRLEDLRKNFQEEKWKVDKRFYEIK